MNATGKGFAMFDQNKYKISKETIFIGAIAITSIGLILFFLLQIEEDVSDLVEGGRLFTANNLAESVTDEVGNEFSGEITAILFALSLFSIQSLKVFRWVTQKIKFTEFVIQSLIRAYQAANKILIPLHTNAGIFAIGSGVVHLVLSNCQRNPFPELGLLTASIIAISGALRKWRVISRKFRQILNVTHQSWISNGIFITLIIIGHSFMGLD